MRNARRGVLLKRKDIYDTMWIIWYVARVMSRCILRALNETTVFDQIEVEMRPGEATFRTRCSNRALVTRFRSRYYLLQIIVLSIKDERKKNVKVQRKPEESVTYSCLVENNVTRTIKMRRKHDLCRNKYETDEN